MIGAIALMALLLIAGSGGGGGGGAGAGSASPNNNNNNAWKDINDYPEKIKEEQTDAYNNSPFLKAISADKAYAELKLNNRKEGGDNVKIAIGYGNNKIGFSGIDPNNPQIANNLQADHYLITDGLYPSGVKSKEDITNLEFVDSDLTQKLFYCDSSCANSPEDNLALNAANIIASSKNKGDAIFNLPSQGIAFNSKISEILYSFYFDDDGSRKVNSQNIFDANSEQPESFEFDFENIKIASKANSNIYAHLNSHEVSKSELIIENQLSTNTPEPTDSAKHSIKNFNNTMDLASNTLMIASTGIKNEGEDKEDFLSYISKNAKPVSNLIFVAPLKDAN